jgi:hypothetical protein
MAKCYDDRVINFFFAAMHNRLMPKDLRTHRW